jgi:hypothetical protein
LFLGVHSLREINRSGGRLRGRKLALAGILTGVAGTLAVVLGVLALVLYEVRVRAAEADCQNHLRQIGLALNHYYDKHKAYPTGTVVRPDLPPEQRLSWYVSILPYLEPDLHKPKAERQKAWEAFCQSIDQQQGWDAAANRQAVTTPLGTLRCPGDPRRQVPGTPALTNYVGVAGYGKDAATLSVEDPDAGVFGYDRSVRRDQVSAGISEVMMVTETAWQNGPWAAGGPATVRGLDPAQKPYIGFDRPFGGTHPHGLFVLYVDGSARFISQSIDPAVFEAMATITADKKPHPGP